MGLLALVGEHLTAEALPSFKTIGMAWTSKPVEKFDQETPACWFYLDEKQSERSPFDNETIQPSDYRVAVLIVCPVSEMEDLHEEVRAALVGFQPGESWEPFEHESGAAVGINASIVWWRDVYATRKYQE